MNNQPLKVAQVGVGNFGGHRRGTLRATGLYDIIALHDWNKEAMEVAAQEEGAIPCESYEALLDTPGLEAVIISTGAKFHAEQVSAALKRGLPAFVEKPLCSTWEETRALIKLQAETGIPVGVGHADHANEAVARTTKAMIDEGQLGAIVAFEKTTAHSGGFQIKPGDWRGDPEKNPGGMLFQCGVHALHELMFYFGPVVDVSCRMRYDVHTTQTADAALCLYSFASGVIGSLHAYHVTPYRHTLSIFGTHTNLYRDERGYGDGIIMEKQSTFLDNAREPREPVELLPGGDPNGQVRAFYKAVRTGEMQYPSLLDGARAVAGVFAAEEAAKTGGVVKVDQI